MNTIVLVLLGAAFPILILIAVVKTRRPRRGKLEIDRATLERAERELVEQTHHDWVVLKRCHGPAYTHTALSELIILLQSEGIEATYDVISTSSAEGGVTNFMLKVRNGQEAAAREVLSKYDASDKL